MILDNFARYVFRCVILCRMCHCIVFILSVYVCVCVFLYAACVGVINDEDANEILLMSSDVL